MAMICTVEGDREMVHPAHGEHFTLEELQGYVGGYIEIVRIGDRWNVVCDEEGKLKGYAPNLLATVLCWRRGVLMHDELCGNVLFVEDGELEP